MGRFRRIEIVDPYYPFSSIRETARFTPKTLTFPETAIFTHKTLTFPSFAIEEPELDCNFAIDLLNPTPSPFELFDSYTDLIQFERTPSFCSYKRIHQRVGIDPSLLTLFDRVSELESKFDRLLNSKVSSGHRKYTCTSDVKGPLERTYRLTAKIKEDKKKKKKKAGFEKNYKWTAQIKGKGENGSRSYTFKASRGSAGESSGPDGEEEVVEKKKKKSIKKEKGQCATRLVEIEEPSDHGSIVLRQVY